MSIKDLHTIALHATHEVEMVALHLNRELPVEQSEYLHLRALVVRILDLNSVAMSFLGHDFDRDTEEMRRVVEGFRYGP